VNHRQWIAAIAAGAVLIASALLLTARTSTACPFCSAVSMTLAEELKTSDAAVIARLVDKPAAPDVAGAPTKSKFEIVRVLKGEAALGGKKQIELLFFGQQDAGTQFLIFGIDPKELMWGTPTPLTERGIEYLDKVAALSADPVDRLAFFQEYLEDEDSWLQSDAFNEFATTAYPEVVKLKDRMHRDQLLKWIADDKIPASRRRLYFTMLGICGKPEDVAMIEGLIKLDDRQVRTGLDAMIGCYLSLKGPDGLPLIDEMFLKNPKSEYVDTYAAIYALRILGQETSVIPKERLMASMRLMLERPTLADMVIPDLARWQDWSVVDKIVQLFKDANEESSWVRVPAVQYLRACPLPVAQEHLVELAKIDPDAVKRANSYFPLAGSAGKDNNKDTAATTTADTAQADSPADDKAVAAPAAEPKTDTPAAEPKAETPAPANNSAATDEKKDEPQSEPAPSEPAQVATTPAAEPTDTAEIKAATPADAASPAPQGKTSDQTTNTKATGAKTAAGEARSPVLATFALVLAVLAAGAVLFRMRRGPALH